MMNQSKEGLQGDGMQPPVTRESIRSLSREQIQKKLKTLGARKAPKPRPGAMCYSPIGNLEDEWEYVWEYTCPKCGEKTLYRGDNSRFVARRVEACRREFNILKGVSDLSLDLNESSYCSYCSPEAQTHQLALVVNYADGSSHTNPSVSLGDLRILGDFLKGELSYTTDTDGIEPLKEKLPRLRELLGVEPKKEGGGSLAQRLARIFHGDASRGVEERG